MTLSIRTPKTEQELDAVRGLMRAFVKWHRENNPAKTGLIDEYFDSGAFENEIASLPGKYTPPHGLLLYATWDDEPAGCVALHELESGCCEMKRMFVDTRFHGKGIGRALGDRLFRAARDLNFRFMRLDTSRDQTQAIGLYKSMGFKKIEPYYDVPEKLRDWLVFMELEL